MTITQALSLDVARESVVRISAKQFDSNSRYLLITVLESGQEQTIPSASTITLNGRRPDGSSQSFLGEVQDGKAYLKIDDYLLEQYGTVYCSVSIIGSDGAKLSTLSFRMVVERGESTGWVLMYTAPSALSVGTYHINVGSISYQFTTTQALPVGGCIYFESEYTGAKTVVNGADVETLTLTVGTGGTELIGSDVVNFLTQISAEVSSINAGLDSKADKSAIEENLAAGTSLATIDKDSYSLSTTPYLHRISPSGKRCEYDVIGGTLGWNQLVQNGDFADGTTGWSSVGTATRTVSNKVLTIASSAINATYRTLSLIDGHKYAFLGIISTSVSTSFGIYKNASGTYASQVTADGNKQNIAKIVNISASSGDTFDIRIRINVATSNTATAENIMVIDLTTLLGSTIADYAYTLEQATAGSGIAWLKSFGFLSKSYYPYSEPTLESVQATARKAVGINQWDEEWESGAFDANGNEIAGTNQIRSKNYTPTIQGATYFFHIARTIQSLRISQVLWYDSNKAFLERTSLASNDATATVPSSASYFRFQTSTVYGNVYLNDICINISNPTINGTYYPYESHTYPLGNVTLRGIPKLDSSNNIYYDGDRRKADGTITRRYGTRAYQSGDESLADAITDGTTTVYKLSTSTTETADPFTPIQYTGSTESFSTDNDVPVGVEAKYYTDLTLPTLPTANGTYTLKCTVTDGTGIVSWVSE